jgi:hypothetical protein
VHSSGTPTNSFITAAAAVELSTLGNSTKLENVVTGETLEGKLSPPHGWNWRNENTEDRVSFSSYLPPHSYAVFELETDHENEGASSK